MPGHEIDGPVQHDEASEQAAAAVVVPGLGSASVARAARAGGLGRGLSPSTIVQLQRSAGNAAVQSLVTGALLQRQPPAAAAPPAEEARSEAVPWILHAGGGEAALAVRGALTAVSGSLIVAVVDSTGVRLYDETGVQIGAHHPFRQAGATFEAGVHVYDRVTGRAFLVKVDPASGSLRGVAEAGVVRASGPGVPRPAPLPDAPDDRVKEAAEPVKPFPFETLLARPDELRFALARHPSGGLVVVFPAGAAARSGSGKGEFTSELEGTGTGPPPNAPSIPARIEGPQLQSMGGTGTYSMRLQYGDVQSGVLAQTLEAMNWVNYHWERYDITAVTDAKARAQARERLRRGQISTGGEVTAMEAAKRRSADEERHAREDVAHATEDRDAALRGTPSWENAKKALASELALELSPISALLGQGAVALGGLADAFGSTHQEREIPWPQKRGVFLIRCVAAPSVMTARGGQQVRRPASVATFIVETHDLQRLVAEGLDAEDPATATQGAASLLEERLGKLRADRAKVEERRQKGELNDWDARHRLDELDDQISSLQDRRTTGEKRRAGRKAYRLHATLVSEITGETYPLLLEALETGVENGVHSWMLSDLTNPEAGEFTAEDVVPLGALNGAIRKFANDCGYGRGLLGVRAPNELTDLLGVAPGRTWHFESAPRDVALAKQRIEDLVKVLMVLGLFVPGLGEAAALIGAAQAAANIAKRIQNHTLHRLDASMVGDLLGIAAGIVTGVQVIGELRVIRLSKGFALASASADEAAIQRLAAELDTATTAGQRVAKANQLLGYAGVAWGDLQTLNALMEINDQEASGAITHAAARRRRAEQVSSAIQNNGMLAWGEIQKLRRGGPLEGQREGTAREDEPGRQKEGDRGREASDREARRAAEDARRQEQEAKLRSAVEAQERSAAGETPPTPDPVAVPEPPVPGPEPRPQRPLGAQQGFRQAIAGAADAPPPSTAAHDVVRDVADWKGALRKLVGSLPSEHRALAEQHLVEARQAIIRDAFLRVAVEFPEVTMSDLGTVSFGSDIDITIRPREPGTTPEATARDIETSAKAQRLLAKLLRDSVAGHETDRALDTNVYSFIGEGRLLPTTPAEQARRANLVRETGFAEQLRGQGEAAFGRFERALLERFAGDSSPYAADARARLQAEIAAGREFFAARENEWQVAEQEVATDGGPRDAQRRRARDRILETKKRELAELAARKPPDIDGVLRKQAEILWFEPDAYATSSAFDQAVGHAQTLRAAGTGATPETAVRDAQAELDRLQGAPQPDQAAIAAARERLATAGRDAADVEAARKALQDAEASGERAVVEARTRALQEALQRVQRRAVGAAVEQTLRTDPARPLTAGERVAHSAGAASANRGLMADHVRAAGADVGAQVKAAAKYGGRILLAEQLASIGTLTAETKVMLELFVKSRWEAMRGEPASELVRDMLVQYAHATGREAGINRDAAGRETGVTPDVQQAFVRGVEAWADQAVARLHAIAATSDAGVAPPEGRSAGPTTPPAGPTPQAGGGGRGGRDTPDTQGGPASERGEPRRPAPQTTRERLATAGLTDPQIERLQAWLTTRQLDALSSDTGGDLTRARALDERLAPLLHDPSVREGLARELGTMKAANAIDVLDGVPAAVLPDLLAVLGDPTPRRTLGAGGIARVAAFPAELRLRARVGEQAYRELAQSQRFGAAFRDRVGEIVDDAAARRYAEDLLTMKPADREGPLGLEVDRSRTAEGVLRAGTGAQRATALEDAQEAVRRERDEPLVNRETGAPFTTEEREAAIAAYADVLRIRNTVRRRRQDLRRMPYAQKLRILERIDTLTAEGQVPRTWGNNARGEIAEMLFGPHGGRQTSVPNRRYPAKGGGRGTSRFDDFFEPGDRPGGGSPVREYLEIKSNELANGPALAAKHANEGLQDWHGLVDNLAQGEELPHLVIHYVRVPSPDVRAAMLERLFAPDSPFTAVAFGPGRAADWVERPAGRAMPPAPPPLEAPSPAAAEGLAVP